MAKSKKKGTSKPAAKKGFAKKAVARKKIAKKAGKKVATKASSGKAKILPDAQLARIINLEDPGPDWEYCLRNGRRVLVRKGDCGTQPGDQPSD